MKKIDFADVFCLLMVCFVILFNFIFPISEVRKFFALDASFANAILGYLFSIVISTFVLVFIVVAIHFCIKVFRKEP